MGCVDGAPFDGPHVVDGNQDLLRRSGTNLGGRGDGDIDMLDGAGIGIVAMAMLTSTVFVILKWMVALFIILKHLKN